MVYFSGEDDSVVAWFGLDDHLQYHSHEMKRKKEESLSWGLPAVCEQSLMNSRPGFYYWSDTLDSWVKHYVTKHMARNCFGNTEHEHSAACCFHFILTSNKRQKGNQSIWGKSVLQMFSFSNIYKSRANTCSCAKCFFFVCSFLGGKNSASWKQHLVMLKF